MDSILPDIEDLSSNIDDLESALSHILQTALSASTSKLPLLDKAKLYILATYAIESVLFSYLRLNGVDAKAHPIFQELTRVKEYFNKIKTAEASASGPASRIDKGAAGRFIKAGLAGNDKYDAERKHRHEGERAGSKRKLEEMSTGTHTRFDGAAKRIKAQEESVNVVKASDLDSEDEEGGVGLEGSSVSTPVRSGSAAQSKAKRRKTQSMGGEGEEEGLLGGAGKKDYKQIKKRINALKAKKEAGGHGLSDAENKEFKELNQQRKLFKDAAE